MPTSVRPRTPIEPETWFSLGALVLSVLHSLKDTRSRNALAVPEYGRGPLILDFA